MNTLAPSSTFYRHPKSQARGFVMLEALISVALTAVVLGILSYYQGFATLQTSRTLQTTEATHLLRQELANIRSLTQDQTAYDKLKDVAAQKITAPTDPTIAKTTQFSKTVGVDDLAPTVAAKTVRVTISWVDSSANTQSVNGATVLAQP